MTRSRKLPYYFLGLQGLSLMGSRMTSIAVGIKLFHDTGHATPLLLLAFFNELPLFFFGNWIGMAADRWKRKTAILVGDTGQMACTALLVGCLVGDIRSLWPLYAIAAVQGLFMALQSLATSALPPLMAQDKDLDRINSLKELLFPLAGVIAPSVAGMLYETSGISGILAADLVTFLLGTGGIAILALPEIKRNEERQERNGLWTEAVQGYRFLWKQKPLLYLFLFFGWWNFILNGPLELAIPYFLQRTGSTDAMSWLLAVMNAGALVGAAAAVWWGHFRYKIRFIFAGSILTSLMFIVLGTSRQVGMMGAALFLLMLPLAMTGALFNSILQRKTPLALQGRVFAAYGQLCAFLAPLSFLVTGPLADLWMEKPWLGNDAGSRIGFLFAASGFLLLTGALWTLSSYKVRRLDAEMEP